MAARSRSEKCSAGATTDKSNDAMQCFGGHQKTTEVLKEVATIAEETVEKLIAEETKQGTRTMTRSQASGLTSLRVFDKFKRHYIHHYLMGFPYCRTSYRSHRVGNFLLLISVWNSTNRLRRLSTCSSPSLSYSRVVKSGSCAPSGAIVQSHLSRV